MRSSDCRLHVHVHMGLNVCMYVDIVNLMSLGNAMGYIRMIRSGGLHCCSNAIRYVREGNPVIKVITMTVFCYRI